MYKIAIIGSKDYTISSKVAKFIQKIYQSFGPTATILSGGSDSGAEQLAKKYALEFNLPYKEYNPSFTGYRMHSALPETYYGKGFHPSHFFDRYKKMVESADKLIVFVPTGHELDRDLETAIKLAKKKNIPCVIIN